MDLHTILKDWIVPIATASAATIGSFVALVGLSSWRRQLHGQSDHELARRILVALFKMRDAIQDVRNPALFSSEMPDPPAEKRETMSAEQIRFFGTSQAYERRWEKVGRLQTELYADIVEAEALWGAESKGLLDAIYGLNTELRQNVVDYLTLQNPEVDERRKNVISNVRKHKRDILYSGPGMDSDNDQFAEDYEAAIRRVESYLMPKLGRKK